MNEHVKDLLKAMGVFTSGVIAYKCSPELADSITKLAENPDTLTHFGRAGRGLTEIASGSVRYLTTVAAPFIIYKVTKNL